ncbi:MAG: P-II family nitrogen regulator [Planctomycetota bacterium]|nr:P-II family nitrogen regulator [Planctomycetota bacterium]
MDAGNFGYRPGKILICYVGRRQGGAVVAAAKAAGARGGTIALGKSLGDSAFLRALALSDIPQDVVFIVLGREAGEVARAVLAASESGRVSGLATLLNVPNVFYRLGFPEPPPDEPSQPRSGKMDSSHVLIAVIVNSGFGEDAMAAARKSGATGGTLLNAHGTGTEEDVSFFGITLVPEKEMLLIVAERSSAPGIVEAIQTLPALAEPGGGIIFTLDVEEFAVLGRK